MCRYSVKNVLLIGLWYGVKKPKINAFLEEFLCKIGMLETEGEQFKTTCQLEAICTKSSCDIVFVKMKVNDFAFEKLLVGHILNKVVVIWFFKLCSFAGFVTPLSPPSLFIIMNNLQVETKK